MTKELKEKIFEIADLYNKLSPHQKGEFLTKKLEELEKWSHSNLDNVNIKKLISSCFNSSSSLLSGNDIDAKTHYIEAVKISSGIVSKNNSFASKVKDGKVQSEEFLGR